jgi:hypothetical protein
VLQQLVGAGQQPHPADAAPVGLGMGSLEPGDQGDVDRLPVSRSNAPTNRPPLIPMGRWIRHTDSSIPPAANASCQASTRW